MAPLLEPDAATGPWMAQCLMTMVAQQLPAPSTGVVTCGFVSGAAEGNRTLTVSLED